MESLGEHEQEVGQQLQSVFVILIRKSIHALHPWFSDQGLQLSKSCLCSHCLASLAAVPGENATSGVSSYTKLCSPTPACQVYTQYSSERAVNKYSPRPCLLWRRGDRDARFSLFAKITALYISFKRTVFHFEL